MPPPGLRSGGYIATDAGVNLADDLSISSGSISLSPGVRWDFSTGYAIKLSDQITLAPEVELGVIYNALASASAGPYSGSYLQVPVMANAILNWQMDIPNLVFYAGGGAGLDFNILNVSGVNGIGLDVTGGETDFAWQVMAGVKYSFGSSEVGVGYKYLAVQPSGLETEGNNTILLCYTLHF